MMRAIETSYAGHRFRSRLEARWAVFMDKAAVQWEYEPEGYETAAGRYLPDFYLPALGEWLEIKPRVELIDTRDRSRIAAFAAEQNSIHFLVGTPWPTEHQFYDSDCAPTSAKWIACTRCRNVIFSPIGKLPGEQRFWCQVCERASETRNGFAHASSRVQLDGGAVGLAFIAARRARFEHGETPATPHLRPGRE